MNLTFFTEADTFLRRRVKALLRDLLYRIYRNVCVFVMQCDAFLTEKVRRHKKYSHPKAAVFWIMS